ncbi:hypothetical protein BDR26DRAFT_430984 [Obelidium mucronatum]|nr:hypothetical protein BDR26DRAFT_430984 [Obelidium mucronatum]
MVEPIQTRNAATAAESELKTTKNPCIIKAPKTSLDYSRFEKIGDDADDPEPVPPTPTVAQPAASKKTEISTEPKPKPYSLKTNAKNFKTVEEKLLEIANQHKILGNEAIRVSDPISAIKHYTDAIETCLHPKRQQITEYESKEKSQEANCW